MEEMNDIKDENDHIDQEKNGFMIIDSYNMNHMNSCSTDAHVSGDCHSDTQDGTGHVSGDCHSETLDGTGQLIDLLLYDFKQESMSEKTCAVGDGNSEEGLTSAGSVRLKDDQDNVRDESDNDDQNNRCSQYNKSDSSATRLNQHIICVHGKDRQHRCIECEKSFTSKQFLTQHINRVHREKKQQCLLCDFRCSMKSDLTQHIRAVHEQLKPYKCSACDKTFSKSGHRDAHYRSVHLGEKPYSCEQCGFKFSQHYNLKQHLKTVHERIKDFICGECGQEFYQKAALTIHIMSVHCEKRPYKCTECNKSFTQLGSLNRHVSSVHEGLKPQKCNECSKNFSTKSDLQKHIRAMHNKDKSEAEGVGARIYEMSKTSQENEKLIMEYENQANELQSWIQKALPQFEKKTEVITLSDCHVMLEKFVEFRSNDKPHKLQEKADLETTFNTLQTRLRLGNKPAYVPANGKLLIDIAAEWTKLETKEEEFEKWLMSELHRLEEIQNLAETFQHMCDVNSDWATKREKELDNKDLDKALMSELKAAQKKHEALKSELAAHEESVDKLSLISNQLQALRYNDMKSIEERRKEVDNKRRVIECRMFNRNYQLQEIERWITLEEPDDGPGWKIVFPLIAVVFLFYLLSEFHKRSGLQ